MNKKIAAQIDDNMGKIKKQVAEKADAINDMAKQIKKN